MHSNTSAKWLSILLVVFVALTFMGITPVMADVSIQQLMDKIDALESKVRRLEGGASRVTPTGRISDKGLLKSAGDIRFGGYVSTLYSLNSNNILNAPAGTVAGTENTTRAFDRDADSFANSGMLSFSKPVSESSRAGFQADILFGRQARIMNAATLSGNTVGEADDNFYVNQAYAEYLAPIGNGLDIIVGHFNTIVGSEVIPSHLNMNSSRGYLWNLAQPATHTGILTSYDYNDQIGFKLGLTNGWDNAVDVNTSKTWLSQVSYQYSDNLSIAQSFLWGPEQVRGTGALALNTESDNRGLLDTVINWTPDASNPGWAIVLNFDYGWEENAGTIGTVRRGSGNATWHGLSLGSSYEVNDKLTVAGRLEYFSDEDGVRIGPLSGATTVGDSISLFGTTLTADYKLADNLLTRLEWRVDVSSDQTFDRSVSAATGEGVRDSQHTFGAEVIYMF